MAILIEYSGSTDQIHEESRLLPQSSRNDTDIIKENSHCIQSMQTQSQILSTISDSQRLKPCFNHHSSQWICPVESPTFDSLEVHFGILKTIILTQASVPKKYLNPVRFKARINYLGLI